MSDSLEEKRALARKLLLQKRAAGQAEKEASFESFVEGSDPALSEVRAFHRWAVESQKEAGTSLERTRLGRADAESTFADEPSQNLVNLASYNYLGLGSHPEVIQAAKSAVDQYGLGCGASPNAGGRLLIHDQLEQGLVDFYGRTEWGVSLFSAGYSVNTGTLSALMKQGCHVVLDRACHMSLVEGARMSGAAMHFFEHNDPEDLAQRLRNLADGKTRLLVCVEGVYSADGDFARLAEIGDTAKRYGALVLVDEAHSALLCGPQGRGVAAKQGVLESVDLLVLTFSKAFGGIGGALMARREITQYVNWFAANRLFSCALSPGMTAGVLKALELAAGDVGEQRRKRLFHNANYLREKLTGKVPLGESQTWIIPVIYGSEKRTLDLCRTIRESGLDASIMEFPAVPKGAARLRLFVSSEHTTQQLDRATAIVLEAAERFNFLVE